MDVHKFMAWFFGFGFLAMFIMANLAFNERDEARSFRASFGDGHLKCIFVQMPEVKRAER